MAHIEKIKQYIAAEKARLALSQEKLKGLKDVVLDSFVSEFQEKRLGSFFGFLASLPEKEPLTHNEIKAEISAKFHGQKPNQAYGVSKELADKITAIQKYGSSGEILKISQPLRQDFMSRVTADENASLERSSITQISNIAEDKLLKLTGHRFDTVKSENYEGWSIRNIVKYVFNASYRDARKSFSKHEQEGNFFDIPQKLQAVNDKAATASETRRSFDINSLIHLESMANKLEYLETHPNSFFSGDILPLFGNDEFASQAEKYLSNDIIAHLQEYRQIGDGVLASRQMIALWEKLLSASSLPSTPQDDGDDGRNGLERTIEQSCADAVEKYDQYLDGQAEHEAEQNDTDRKQADRVTYNLLMGQIRLDAETAMAARQQLLELQKEAAREERIERMRENIQRGGRNLGHNRDGRDRGGYER